MISILEENKAVGILPEMRIHGYVNQIMKLLTNEAISNGIEYITFQVSEMGKSS